MIHLKLWCPACGRATVSRITSRPAGQGGRSLSLAAYCYACQRTRKISRAEMEEGLYATFALLS